MPGRIINLGLTRSSARDLTGRTALRNNTTRRGGHS